MTNGKRKYSTSSVSSVASALHGLVNIYSNRGKKKPAVPKTPKKKRHSSRGKTKRRGKGGRTMTKSRLEQELQEAGTHNSLFKTGNRVIVSKFAKCNGKLGRWKYCDQMYGFTVSVEGKQASHDIGYFVLPANFTSASTTPSASLTKQVVGNGFFNMNPFQKTTGGAATGNTTGITLADDRIILEKIDIKYTFMNGSNVPVTYDLYVVTPKLVSNYSGPKVLVTPAKRTFFLKCTTSCQWRNPDSANSSWPRV